MAESGLSASDHGVRRYVAAFQLKPTVYHPMNASVAPDRALQYSTWISGGVDNLGAVTCSTRNLVP